MSEQLTSFVSDGNSISMHSLIRNVSQGCKIVGEVIIIFTNICRPRVCLWPWSSSTCQPPLTRSTMTHSSPVCQQGLASLELSLDCLQFISWIVFQSVKIGSVISECFKLNFGVPQGSVLGPLLFSLYTSPLTQVIAKFKDVKYYFYADDSQLFVHLSPGKCANSFHQLKACLDDIHIWMLENKLKLNPGKTEFTVFGSMDKYKWLNLDSFPVSSEHSFIKISSPNLQGMFMAIKTSLCKILASL